jgi:hypothetical protein
MKSKIAFGKNILKNLWSSRILSYKARLANIF